jgi:hypothetical protein
MNDAHFTLHTDEAMLSAAAAFAELFWMQLELES